MKSFITVIGHDTVGIIASIANILADRNVNILDINQTVMGDMFTMIMMVDTEKLSCQFADLSEKLTEYGKDAGLSVRIQREEIFNSMHRI
ncbi:MAG: ACT domain-containing protein [Spirochaetales bacterium]|nr:ACT domain-containing protein [Spirochaetales bacterium]